MKLFQQQKKSSNEDEEALELIDNEEFEDIKLDYDDLQLDELENGLELEDFNDEH